MIILGAELGHCNSNNILKMTLQKLKHCETFQNIVRMGKCSCTLNYITNYKLSCQIVKGFAVKVVLFNTTPK
jgi:hypothetical protein